MRLRTVVATRYVTPLREGGSLPAIIEADDDGLYVMKFRGAGQGPKALIAELIAGELARLIGLPIPEIVFMTLDGDLARTEPDVEIQDLIRSSSGLNLALDYLPGALTSDALTEPPSATLASTIVWHDAFVTNVDRTPRNTNMLFWHRHLWLIDHGAALFFHHDWATAHSHVRSPFSRIKDHVLLPFASELRAVDAHASTILGAAGIRDIVSLVPDDWMKEAEAVGDRDQQRAAYGRYLIERLESPRPFVEEAIRARSASL